MRRGDVLMESLKAHHDSLRLQKIILLRPGFICAAALIHVPLLQFIKSGLSKCCKWISLLLISMSVPVSVKPLELESSEVLALVDLPLFFLLIFLVVFSRCKSCFCGFLKTWCLRAILVHSLTWGQTHGGVQCLKAFLHLKVHVRWHWASTY